MFGGYYANPQQYPAPDPQPSYRPAPAPPGPQSNIVCANCTTLLLYPQGAQNVRCARCGEITPVPQAAGDHSAQLACSNPQCRVVLMYPRGASQVQCSLCHTINNAMGANQIGHIVCGSCHITLMYAYGAASVKCQVCNAVTPANQSTMTHQPGPSNSNSGSGAASSRPQESQQAVVVVNPPTLDAEGNEVEDYVVGVSSDPGQQAARQHSRPRHNS